MIAVLVFLLVGCDDTWFGVPRDGPVPAGDGGSGGATARYHPDGYADPSQHGGAAKASVERCVSCHGEDLTGEGDALSCDTCHAEGWRTDCTRCHGGTDDASGAPPRYIAGGEEGALATFWSHTPHGSGELGAAVSCGTCHVVPTDVLSDGHL
ncbi:MAG: hypothetical protein VX000_18530, partial [Myxococcota bacterium]|nr:hypothetical protein [Myxococcota bacterium]